MPDARSLDELEAVVLECLGDGEACVSHEHVYKAGDEQRIRDEYQAAEDALKEIVRRAEDR